MKTTILSACLASSLLLSTQLSALTPVFALESSENLSPISTATLSSTIGYYGLDDDYKNVEYYLDKPNDNLIFTGTGAIRGHVYVENALQGYGHPWYSSRSKTSTITIREGITQIGSACFADFVYTSYASLPSTLEVILNSVFRDCKYLDINGLPEGLKSIGEYSFYKTDLSSVTKLPDTLETIGERCFTGTNISISYLPSSITAMGDWVFSGCTKITSMSLPSHMSRIPEGTFSGCSSLSKVTLPPAVKTIERYAFNSTALTEVILPNTVTELGSYAFDNCSDLKTVSLSDGMTEMPYLGFWNCTALESVFIPASITEFNKPFSGKYPNMTIYGFAGSAAETYCAENDYKFVAVTSAPSWASISVGNTGSTNSSTSTDSNTNTNTNTTPVLAPWAEGIYAKALSQNLLVNSLGGDFTQDISRLQIADLLVNMVENYTGKTLSPSSTTFSDCNDSQVLKAYGAGIIGGKGDGKFAPEESASREEMALMTYKALLKMEELTGRNLIVKNSQEFGFSDQNLVDTWANVAVQTLANNGIMGGSDGKFNPDGNITIQESLSVNNNLFALD